MLYLFLFFLVLKFMILHIFQFFFSIFLVFVLAHEYDIDNSSWFSLKLHAYFDADWASDLTG